MTGGVDHDGHETETAVVQTGRSDVEGLLQFFAVLDGTAGVGKERAGRVAGQVDVGKVEPKLFCVSGHIAKAVHAVVDLVPERGVRKTDVAEADDVEPATGELIVEVRVEIFERGEQSAAVNVDDHRIAELCIFGLVDVEQMPFVPVVEIGDIEVQLKVRGVLLQLSETGPVADLEQITEGEYSCFRHFVHS